METVRWSGGPRLRDEISAWFGGEGGIEAFVAALQKTADEVGEEIPGANRAMVQRYLGGRAVPSIDFLSAAAALLGVRFEWLALGREPRTVEEPRRIPKLKPRGIEVLAGFRAGLREAIRRGAPEVDRASEATQLLFLETLCRYLLTYSDAWEELGFAQAQANLDGGTTDDYESSVVEWEIVEDYAQHLYSLLTFDHAEVMSGKPFRSVDDFERQLKLTAAVFDGWLPPIGEGRSIAEQADLLFDRITRTRVAFYEESGIAKSPNWESTQQQKMLKIRDRENSRKFWREQTDRRLAADAAERAASGGPSGGEP